MKETLSRKQIRILMLGPKMVPSDDMPRPYGYNIMMTPINNVLGVKMTPNKSLVSVKMTPWKSSVKS